MVKLYFVSILWFYLFFYGYEMWSHTLREEHRLRKCESRVLRGLFRAKKDEETGEWRNLHKKGLHNFCSSSYWVIKSRRMRGTVYTIINGRDEKYIQNLNWKTLKLRDHLTRYYYNQCPANMTDVFLNILYKMKYYNIMEKLWKPFVKPKTSCVKPKHQLCYLKTIPVCVKLNSCW
jgi:hypothetical protein